MVGVGKQYLITGPPPSTAPPTSPPPERPSTNLAAFFKRKDGTNPKSKKIVQKGMHTKSGGGVNLQETLLSDTKKSKPKAFRSGKKLSSGGVRSGGVSTGGG